MAEDSKILISESTKKVLEEELDESFDDLSDEEIIKKANESKNVSVTIAEDGKVKVRQALNG